MQSPQSNIESLEKSVRLYSLHKAAALLGIGRDTLIKLIDNGEIATIKVIGRQKISLAELLRFSSQPKKSLPSVLQTALELKSDNISRRKVECANVDEIFNNVKKEILKNEKKD